MTVTKVKTLLALFVFVVLLKDTQCRSAAAKSVENVLDVGSTSIVGEKEAPAEDRSCYANGHGCWTSASCCSGTCFVVCYSFGR